MKTILSIDIGIQNLAHCWIGVENKALSIHSWDVLNLTDHRTCSCLEKATHELDTTYFCKKHCQHATKTLSQCIQLCSTHKLPLGTKDEMVASLKRHTKKLSPPTLVDLGKQIIEKYARFTVLPDVVVIENQIGPLASKMKAIQGLVIQYWLMRHVKVECVSACNKLKLFHEGKTTYKERKQLSIQYATQLIQQYQLQDHGFYKHKKKDDLADTLLQGFWYINCGFT
jgi:hypothetical protein